MSVIMTFRVHGDPKRLEAVAAQNPDRIRAVSERAKDHGCIGHRFYGSDDGQIIVIDEWPDPGSFQSFFDANQADIGPIMEEAGVEGEPEVTFWHKLETHDEIGWES